MPDLTKAIRHSHLAAEGLCHPWRVEPLAGGLLFLKLNRANMLKQTGDSAPGGMVEAKAGMQARTHIAVIGAGAFGGWTALYLLRRGVRVTLLDAWGPGNSRASSGGETRVLRATYGPRAVYTHMAVRA